MRQSDQALCEAQVRDQAALLHRSVVAVEDQRKLADRAKSLHDRNAGIARMSVLDEYLVHPGLSLLEKTPIQAQVLVPVLRALRSELGKEKADAIVKQALRGW